ncbi:MAG TPA: hypothetical protein VFS30_05975 [Dehalococcoidia bacterium]|nr:hypothetical protein [Dehalococcoidia bacterium]
MRNPILGLPQRLAAVTVVSLLLAFGAAVPVEVASADANNQQNVVQEEIEVPGDAVSSGGVANAGSAMAQAVAVVRQLNVQVAAGDLEALANSSQTATNTAGVTQTVVAVAGDATATDGGTATTGYAISGAMAVVLQLNIQIMALLSPECVVTQVASNDANVDQTAAAISGEATAAGANSEASSGNAHAWARQFSLQRNVQIYVCTGRNLGSTGNQEASNSLAADQTAAAISGNASALTGSGAATGNTRAWSSDLQRQVNRQIVID